MKADKIRVGVIGLGIMGEQYVRIYEDHPRTTVTAICTRKRSKPRPEARAESDAKK